MTLYQTAIILSAGASGSYVWSSLPTKKQKVLMLTWAGMGVWFLLIQLKVL